MMTYSIKEILEKNIAPIKDRKLRKLIWNGELFKKKLYEGIDYIRAVNIGTEVRPRWAIKVEEVEAWVLRKSKDKKDKLKT